MEPYYLCHICLAEPFKESLESHLLGHSDDEIRSLAAAIFKGKSRCPLVCDTKIKNIGAVDTFFHFLYEHENDCKNIIDIIIKTYETEAEIVRYSPGSVTKEIVGLDYKSLNPKLAHNLKERLYRNSIRSLRESSVLSLQSVPKSTKIEVLNVEKFKFNELLNNDTNGKLHSGGSPTSSLTQLPQPKITFFPRENVQIGWSSIGRTWMSGCGFQNVGNTCYLNSALQAFFHVSALANWLANDEEHREKGTCQNYQQCIICAMAQTLLSTQRQQHSITPSLITDRLGNICKNMSIGRQEDSHEFLRYLVEQMEKSFLDRYKHMPWFKELDQYSKETTPLSQILGGYLRSTITCTICKHESITFQHFMDLPLDINRAATLNEALDEYFACENLEECGYNCESCKEKVSATKRFSLERAPAVLCIQLKRFQMLANTTTTIKNNKSIKFSQYLDLRKYLVESGDLNQHCQYKLVSLVTHVGVSASSGHYTAIGLNPSGSYCLFDDSCVSKISMENVLQTNAYVLFYELVPRNRNLIKEYTSDDDDENMGSSSKEMKTSLPRLSEEESLATPLSPPTPTQKRLSLVPYETDEEDEEQPSQTVITPSKQGSTITTKASLTNGNERDPLQQLTNHNDYETSEDASCNNTPSNMNQEVSRDQQEDRKRQIEDDRELEIDSRRVKKVRHHDGQQSRFDNLLKYHNNTEFSLILAEWKKKKWAEMREIYNWVLSKVETKDLLKTMFKYTIKRHGWFFCGKRINPSHACPGFKNPELFLEHKFKFFRDRKCPFCPANLSRTHPVNSACFRFFLYYWQSFDYSLFLDTPSKTMYDINE